MPLSMFNAGNAKHGKKSECRKCQNKRHSEYKKIPKVREARKKWAREKTAKEPRYVRTLRYLKKKPYYDEWKKNNPDKYRIAEKRKAHTRRAKFIEGGILHTSSIVLLENYNITYFSSSEFKCEYCSSLIIGTYYLDHVIPICKNGNNKITNLAISCKKCNGTGGKWKYLLEEWKPELVIYITERNKKWPQT